ncbi:hypothetical protein ACFR99_15065 [Haloarchaeobius amylolyticus]|uniref:Uncharacterized protein n=1 Tax=Haloarchaeobius amylolyticus TaxID=1198296 RepID=A0ABD6BIG1_9EURY
MVDSKHKGYRNNGGWYPDRSNSQSVPADDFLLDYFNNITDDLFVDKNDIRTILGQISQYSILTLMSEGVQETIANETPLTPYIIGRKEVDTLGGKDESDVVLLSFGMGEDEIMFKKDRIDEFPNEVLEIKTGCIFRASINSLEKLKPLVDFMVKYDDNRVVAATSNYDYYTSRGILNIPISITITDFSSWLPDDEKIIINRSSGAVIDYNISEYNIPEVDNGSGEQINTNSIDISISEVFIGVFTTILATILVTPDTLDSFYNSYGDYVAVIAFTALIATMIYQDIHTNNNG